MTAVLSSVQIACPSCGSPVHFRSEKTLYASCGNCRTMLVRKDVTLEPVGEVGEIQPDGTLLKIGTQGTFEGNAFFVIGRIQVVLGNPKSPDGFWNEWCVSYNNGQLGWIGEAQGQYFVSFVQEVDGNIPYSRVKIGESMVVGPTHFVVTSKSKSRVVTFEGELPFVTREDYDSLAFDFRSATTAALTVDYSDDEPVVYLGKWCTFDDLKFSNLRTEEDDQQMYSRSSASTVGLKCRGCGAALELRAGPLTKGFICEYCGTATDMDDPVASEVIKFNKSKASVPATVPLGKVLKFEGSSAAWNNIGYLRKSVTIDGINYEWCEYLLYDRKYGFRWLVESDNHWLFLEPMFELPTDAAGLPVGDPLGSPVLYNGETYKHFQSARSRVVYAAGEFYWKVKIGESGMATDYVCPPRLISLEVQEDEINWTRGRYIEPEEVYKAAGLTTTPPARTSVGPAQPNPYREKLSQMWKTYLFFALLAVLLMAGVAAASNKKVWTQDFIYKAYEPERSQVFDLKLDGRTSNLKFKVASPNISQRWASFQMTLINETDHTALDCSTFVSFYRDADGSYGSRLGDAMLPSVKPGSYVLRIEPTTGTAETPEPNGPVPALGTASPDLFTYRVEIYRDVPLWSFVWIYIGVLLVPPLWVGYKSSSFETRRWAESDHAEDDSEDDDND